MSRCDNFDPSIYEILTLVSCGLRLMRGICPTEKCANEPRRFNKCLGCPVWGCRGWRKWKLLPAWVASSVCADWSLFFIFFMWVSALWHRNSAIFGVSTSWKSACTCKSSPLKGWSGLLISTWHASTACNVEPEKAGRRCETYVLWMEKCSKIERIL